MVWEYNSIDRALANAVKLRLPIGARGAVPGANGYGKNKRGHVDIKFQFPPKVISDSRKGEWKEPEKMQGTEPVAEFKFTGPRVITLNWSYVVESDDEDNVNAWTVPRISHYVRTLRGYFVNGRNVTGTHEELVVYFWIWALGGEKEMTARLRSVDVKYGDTIVAPFANTNLAFPLRTDISVDLRLWSTGLGEGGDDVLEDVNKLKNLPIDWY